MIVNRLTFNIRPGKMEQAVEMLKAARETLDDPSRARIYTSNVARFNVLVDEIEFENLAEFDAFWTAWWSNPETPAFMEKWNQLVDAGGGGEIWNVEE